MKIVNLFQLTFPILTLTSFLLFTSAQEVYYPPRLPLYIGKGYNILHGNPISANGVDPGFNHQIFQFTFDKHQTTEDGKYQIPDQISHRKTTACSFSTEISQYRGTESYQNLLKTKAQISGGYKGILFKASFSASASYEKMHNETMSQNKTITHASAQCQCYEMSIDLFKPGTISQNFWLGVNSSFNANNWDKFIDQFGTHFVYEVVLGGRATQQIIYDWKSISEMETIGIDINIAAKAKFANYYGDTTFNWSNYKTQMKYIETLSVSIHQIYVGGHAPTTGHIEEWHQKVIEDPMPITYKVLPLSELFSFNKDKTINVDQAKTSFLAALDHYCAQNKCKQPSPDKPTPPPAKVIVQSSQSFGGNGGSQYLWQKVHPALNLHKVFIRNGQQIDRIQIQISDGVEFFISPQFGGSGGSDRQPWQVPAGEYVHQIQYRSGYRIDSLTFVTNKGNRSPRYGGNGGSYNLLTLPQGYRIIGIFGRSGQGLDRLGFRIAKTLYNHEINQEETIYKNLVVNVE